MQRLWRRWRLDYHLGQQIRVEEVQQVQWYGEGVKHFPGLPPVDRSLFIPDEIWVSVPIPWDNWTEHMKATLPSDTRVVDQVLVSRSGDQKEWQRWVDSDEALATRIKDGKWPSSSSSAPRVMAIMIAALDLKPGMTVLEIGTGTGFNAACLSALGADVVSIEVQKDVADQAIASLSKAGYRGVKVITGDGALGAPQRAPYDRVISTAAVHTIPYTWVEQTKEAGKLVTPYTGEFHSSALLVLSVSEGIAEGGMEGMASFMPLTGQGLAQADLTAIEDRSGLKVRVGPEGQTISFE